jgi:hypothetical protein
LGDVVIPSAQAGFAADAGRPDGAVEPTLDVDSLPDGAVGPTLDAALVDGLAGVAPPAALRAALLVALRVAPPAVRRAALLVVRRVALPVVRGAALPVVRPEGVALAVGSYRDGAWLAADFEHRTPEVVMSVARRAPAHGVAEDARC